LKYFKLINCFLPIMSLPARGAWIEISISIRPLALLLSLPARGAWIEIGYKKISARTIKSSLPARGAWIEILNIYLIN